MASVASQPPVRTPSGGTTDQIFQPLADCGNGNPAFYHQYFDDFDQAISFNATGGTGTYTTTASSTGTWTQVSPGLGGQGLLTVTTTATNDVQIQLPAPSFSQNIAPKKLFFETRVVATSNPTTSNLIVGLCNTGNVFTAATGAAAVTNGIYFKYVGATNVLTINQVTSSTVVSATIPTAAYTISGGGQFDLAFYQTRLGDILAFVDTQLVGFVPQSNIGTTGNPQNAGAAARILGTSYTATATIITPTLALWTTTIGATATFDFLTVEQER